MKIGIPKEIKNHEYRVGLVPASVAEFITHGHEAIVEKNAGLGIGFTNDDYRKAGATIIETAKEVFDSADMIVKVKEPQPQECEMLREDQILYTYLHLAPDPKQTELLIKSKAVCIAYETVTDDRGRLPLLAPMSEVAGRMSVQAGAHALEKAQGGSGVLLGGVPGVEPGNIVIIGGGVVGENALQIASGMRANVTVFDKSLARLKELDDRYGGRIHCLFATRELIGEHVAKADLVIGAVLVPGASAPKIITREMLRTMKPGSVFVDVAIDQGGCAETSRATTHADPTYVEENVVHYCVANMPGGVARTSTFALNNATLPFGLAIADKGWEKAIKDDNNLKNGLNVCRGHVTHKAVADALGYELYEYQ